MQLPMPPRTLVRPPVRTIVPADRPLSRRRTKRRFRVGCQVRSGVRSMGRRAQFDRRSRRFRRRQCDRSGIVAAGEFDQRRNAGLDARMGVEQFAKTFTRIIDAHFHHRGRRAGQFAAAFDLAQRRDHGVGILGELHRTGIGEEFTRARQRQPDDERQHVSDDEEADGDEDRDDLRRRHAASDRPRRKLKPL